MAFSHFQNGRPKYREKYSLNDVIWDLFGCNFVAVRAFWADILAKAKKSTSGWRTRTGLTEEWANTFGHGLIQRRFWAFAHTKFLCFPNHGCKGSHFP